MFGKLLRLFIAFRLFKWMRGRRRSRWTGRGWGGGIYYDPLHGHGLAGLFARRRRSFI